VKKGQNLWKISGFSIVTQRILIGLHIWIGELRVRLELHNLHTDHVTIWSELKYPIGGKVAMLKCRDFGGKTGPFLMDPVFWVVRPIATVQFQVEQDPGPTREFGPVANTTAEMRRQTALPSYVLFVIKFLAIHQNMGLAPWRNTCWQQRTLQCWTN
jgi:hypothetical protein